jgi:hypothetical protein
MGGYPEAVRVFGGEDRLYGLLIDLNESVFPKQTVASDTHPQPSAGNRPSLH